MRLQRPAATSANTGSKIVAALVVLFVTAPMGRVSYALPPGYKSLLRKGSGLVVDASMGRDMGQKLSKSLEAAALAPIMATGPVVVDDLAVSVSEAQDARLDGPFSEWGMAPKEPMAVIAALPSSSEARSLAVDPKYTYETSLAVKNRYGSGILQCYQAAMREDPTLQGKLTMRLGIDEAGMVTNSDVSGLSRPLCECIETRSQSWRFDAPSASAEVELPIVLHRGNL